MSENNYFDGETLALGIIVSLLTGFGIGTLLGQWSGRQDIRKEAVKTGVARYVAAEDGDSKFEWIVPSEKKP